MPFDLYHGSKTGWVHVCGACGQIVHALRIAYFAFRLAIFSNNPFIHADVKDFFLCCRFMYFLMSKHYSETSISTDQDSTDSLTSTSDNGIRLKKKLPSV